jgi:hypothetical protein
MPPLQSHLHSRNPAGAAMSDRPTDPDVALLRTKAELFVRPGYRDEDGVWHDGPHRVEFDAALARLAARLEAAECALASAEEWYDDHVATEGIYDAAMWGNPFHVSRAALAADEAAQTEEGT